MKKQKDKTELYIFYYKEKISISDSQQDTMDLVIPLRNLDQ